jgi:predicted transposase/invertase (TIGR01784 family)
MVNGEKFINDPGMLPDAIKKEVTIMKAIHKMQKAASDPELRAIIEYREKAIRDEADKLSFAEKKGELRGEKRGELRAKELIAIKMMAKNKSLEEIIEFTGLSKTDIMKLKQ